MKKECSKDCVNYIILLIIVLVLCLIKLNSSIIKNYLPEVDSSVFQVMGRGLIRNQTIYKDIFDHKGPIVYVINALAYIINPKIGLFIIELIFLYIGVIFIYKNSRFFLNEKLSMLISVIYLMPVFSYIDGGNYTEEYAITFTNIALYYIMKIFFKNEYDKRSNWVIIGITFAINFMIKPTYIAIWVAFAIVQLISSIRNKKIKDLLKYILYMFYGIMLIFIPIFLYLIIKNNMKDFINAYFLMNMNYSKATVYNKIVTFKELVCFYNGIIYLIFILLGNICLFFNKKTKKKIKWFVTIFNIILLIFSAWAANIYQHYLLQISSGVALNIIILLDTLKNKLKSEKIKKIYKFLTKRIIYCLIIVFMLVIIVFYGFDIGYEKYKYEYNYNKKIIILQINKYLNEDDEIFTLGNDASCYIILNKQPQFKYFFQIPIFNYDDEIMVEIENYIRSKMPKVILKSTKNSSELFEEKCENIKEILNENYKEYDKGQIKYYVLKEN